MLKRKLGHIPEYLLLGLSSVIALRRWWKAGIFCVAISFIDEIVKEIIPEREIDFVEKKFDFIGYTIGIGIISLAIKIKGRET